MSFRARFKLLLFAAPLALGLVLSTSAMSYDKTQVARFARCSGPVRSNCVVDGDTIWYRGDKIRLADINAPELSEPRCANEARLSERAARRLTQLLNEGPFTLERIERDRDRYGRLLRIARRRGESLGEVLVREGLAERWRGHRRDWCRGQPGWATF